MKPLTCCQGPLVQYEQKAKREKAVHRPWLSNIFTFFFFKKAEKFRVLQSGISSPLVQISTGSFRPCAISSFTPQPWQVQHNKTERNTEPFAKDLTWAAATWSSKQTGLCTVPRVSFSTRKPQAQAGEVSCTARPCHRGAHSTGLLPWMPQPLGHATWAFYGAAGVLRGTICYSLHVLFVVIHSIL